MKRPAFWIVLAAVSVAAVGVGCPLLSPRLLDRRPQHHDGPRACPGRGAARDGARRTRPGRTTARRRPSPATTKRRPSSSSKAAARKPSRGCCAISCTPRTPGACGTSKKAKPTRPRSGSRRTASRTASSSGFREDAPGAALDAAGGTARSPRAARDAVERRLRAIRRWSSRARSAARPAASTTPSPTNARPRRLKEGRYRLRLVVSGDRLTEVDALHQDPRSVHPPIREHAIGERSDRRRLGRRAWRCSTSSAASASGCSS